MIIPKVIHQIWIGNKDFPAMYGHYRESFLSLNPDWSLMLWTEENLKCIPLRDEVLKVLNKSSVHPAFRKDIIAAELLFIFGGIFSDLDIICKKPLNDLRRYSSFCGEAYRGQYTNFFYGCEKGNKIIRDMAADGARNLIESKETDRDKLLSICGIDFQSRYLKDLECIYDSFAFAPFPCWDISGRDKEWPEATIIHLWKGVEGWTRE